MNEKMQMIIILFLFAFLIGFFIVHFIRKGALKRKYEAKIQNLQEEDHQSAALYAQSLEEKKALQQRYDTTHKRYKEQKELFENLKEKEASLVQRIAAAEEQKKEFGENIVQAQKEIEETKEQIKQLSTELSSLSELRTLVSEKETQIKDIRQRIEDEEKLLHSYLEDIEKIKASRKKLQEENKELEEQTKALRRQLDETEEGIARIDKKYSKALIRVQKNRDDLKIKAINYEYALKEYKEIDDEHQTKVKNKLVQTLFGLPATKTKEIENIIKKNDSLRWIDKLAKKVFHKKPVIDEEI